SAWHTARTLAALCNGSSPTVQRIKSVVGDTVPFEYSSHITRSLVHIEHNYSDPATRVSIRQLINDFVMIPD
ncbi:MAG: hypothetical protein KC680_02560, partial [Candidatus Peregrinibacteria bacterium]|nr:hypothetical protein [Candidatus Peregrinibacteria bacterium]